MIDFLPAIASDTDQLVRSLESKILRYRLPILRFLFLQPIKQPLQVLQRILLMPTAKLRMLVSNQHFKIIRLDTFLILLGMLLFVDDLCALQFLGILA